MDGLGRAFSNALAMVFIIGLVLGVGSVVIGWALWHYVVSHIAVSWR